MPPIITCENLGVHYKDFSQFNIQKIHHLFNGKKKTKWALKNISFCIQEGDIVGIIGKNGAGKSTLARIIAGVYKPDDGYLQVEGKVTLLSLALGFNNELTGIDNIYISGMYQGIPLKEIKKKINGIVHFSELSQHINKPIKYYSSGMKARLAFAIATCHTPEILIIDEALSAGDASFKKKSSQRLQEIIKAAKCVVLVSHSVSLLRTVCNKGIVLDQGQLIQNVTTIDEALTIYNSMTPENIF